MGVCCANREEVKVNSNLIESNKNNNLKTYRLDNETKNLLNNNSNGVNKKINQNTNNNESILAPNKEVMKKEQEGFDIGNIKEKLREQSDDNSNFIKKSSTIKKENQKGLTTKTLNEVKYSNKDFKIKSSMSKNNGNISDDYMILNKLGKGSFGTVYKVQHKSSGLNRAMKVISKEIITYQDDEQQFLKEIEILMKQDHVNILKGYEYYEDNSNYYLVTELITNGELYEYILKSNSLDEIMVRNIFQQLMSVVNYLHKNNIIHRDLKPENILVDTINDKYINIKVIDFGTCNFFKKGKNLNLQVGSPYYIAPEVLNENYNEKCDIWSCGCILYILLVGYPPFEASTHDKLVQKIKEGKFTTKGENWDLISKEAKDLVQKMLLVDYEKRPSAEEILKHVWFSKSEKNICKADDLKPIFKNFQKFVEKDKLQQATLNYIIHNFTESKEFEKLRSIFLSLDENKDGTLSKAELLKGFKEGLGMNIRFEEINLILDSIDTDQNGEISYQEFLSSVIDNKKVINRKNLKLCFESFDINKDGKLSVEELKSALGTNNTEYIHTLINSIDKNDDQEIDLNEFLELMEKIQVKS